MNPIKYILAFTVIALQFQLTHASTSLDIEVYGLHKDITRQIESGDTLFSGDSFQISIKSSIKQNIFVVLKDSNGDVNLLKTNNSEPYSINHNGTFYYPGRDHWYKLDNSTGTETLYVLSGNSNSCTKQLVTDIAKENLTSILKDKSCTSQEITFNHILQDLSLLSSQRTRGLNNISNEESENILIKYSSVIKTYNQNDDFISIPNKIDYQSLSAIPPTLRGIKEVHLFKELSPSVVLITTKSGSGSGSLINNNGEILTNWHVVGDNKIVGVVFKPSTRRSLKKGDIVIADVLKVDEISDLALIKVRQLPNNIKTIKFGNNNQLNEGEDVHAIGHPQGQNWSYTKGVISSLRVDYEWNYNKKNTHKAKLVIQTQTPIITYIL